MTDKKQDVPQADWEDEGGSLAPEPTQTTRKGLKIPMPKRRDLMADIRKLIKPAPKKL